MCYNLDLQNNYKITEIYIIELWKLGRIIYIYIKK